MPIDITAMILGFFESLASFPQDFNSVIYNEFSLQHELGIYLRCHLPCYKIQFERNVKSFGINVDTCKKEMDITLVNKCGENEKYAIELKFPKNRAYGKRMSQFVQDIRFAEELKKLGFTGAYAVTVVDDPGFYQKGQSEEAFYGCFRNGEPIKSPDVHGTYTIRWKTFPNAPDSNWRYYIVEAQ